MCIPHRSKRPIVSRPCVPPHRRKIDRFCFKCPANFSKTAHVYPPSTRRNARGARACGFFAPLRRPPGGLPFSNVKRPQNACCAGALRLFSCPGCWGYGIAMPEELRPAFGVVNKCGVRPHLWKRRGRRRRGRRRGEGVDPKSGNFRKESNTI